MVWSGYCTPIAGCHISRDFAIGPLSATIIARARTLPASTSWSRRQDLCYVQDPVDGARRRSWELDQFGRKEKMIPELPVSVGC